MRIQPRRVKMAPGCWVGRASVSADPAQGVGVSNALNRCFKRIPMLPRIRDVLGALELLREHRVVTVTPSGPLPSIVGQVVGGPVKGSWWGHPDGKLIFRICSALAEHDEVLAVKLVEGKITFVHRTLWPALLRVVTDGRWRKGARASLGKMAQRLFGQIENNGELHMAAVEGNLKPDMRGAMRKAKLELEKSLLVLSTSEHTSAGKHESVLISWRRWAERVRATEATASFADALAELQQACQNQPTTLGV